MPCQCDQEKAGCACNFVAGLNVTLDGAGTQSSPIVIHVANEYLTAIDGDNTTATVTGTGDISSPYLVRIDVDAALLTGTWNRWEGVEEELTTRPPAANQLAIVNFPTRHLVGLQNLYAGAQRLVRVYVGDMMVADDLGLVLGPGL